MANISDLEGLPEPVAKALVETVLNLKSHYRTVNARSGQTPKDLPSRPGKVIGSLRRVDIYEDR